MLGPLHQLGNDPEFFFWDTPTGLSCSNASVLSSVPIGVPSYLHTSFPQPLSGLKHPSHCPSVEKNYHAIHLLSDNSQFTVNKGLN